MVCVILGANKAVWRQAGAICAFITCFFHLIAIIVTLAFRFRPMGQLCAIMTAETNYTSSDVSEKPTDDWTYEKDGSLILGIAIL